VLCFFFFFSRRPSFNKAQTPQQYSSAEADRIKARELSACTSLRGLFSRLLLFLPEASSFPGPIRPQRLRFSLWAGVLHRSIIAWRDPQYPDISLLCVGPPFLVSIGYRVRRLSSTPGPPTIHQLLLPFIRESRN